MTTGRINQVTTFPLSRNCSAKSSVHDPSNTCYQPLLVAFLVRSLSLDQWAILTMTTRSIQLVQPTKQLRSICQTTLIPRSHKFLVHVILSLLKNATKCHSLQRELPMTNIAWKCPLIMADSQLAICFWLGHRQEVHNASSMQAIHITWLFKHE